MLRLIPLARIALICATVVACLSIARADTITHTFSAPQGTTTWSQAVNIPRFDPALGKLQSVSVQFDKHVRWSMGVTVVHASPPWTLIGEMNASVVTTLEYASNGVDLCAVLYREPEFVFWMDRETYPLPATFIQSGEADCHASGSVPSGDLGLWIGAGSVPLTLRADGTSSHTASYSHAFPGAMSWYIQYMQTVSVAGDVVYEYVP